MSGSRARRAFGLGSFLGLACLIVALWPREVEAVFQKYLGAIRTASLTNDGTLSQTGAATFAGAVTINGAATLGSNVTFTGSPGVNWVFVSSQNVVDVATVTFSGLSSSTTYRLEYVSKSTEAYHLMVLFNSDNHARYKFNALAASQGASVGYHMNSRGCVMDSDYAGYTLLPRATLTGEATFSTIHGSSVTVSMRGAAEGGEWFTAGYFANGFYTACRYTGLNPLTSLQIVTTTLAMPNAPNHGVVLSGYFALYRSGAGARP